MNRSDLQNLTKLRLKEAKALLDKKLFSGSYYLCGYAVECALKAYLAKQTKEHDFPNKKIAIDSYTHNLSQLIRVGGLQTALDHEMDRDSKFAVNWAIVKDWSEESRYEIHSSKAANALYLAVTDRNHGVHRWLKRHW